MSWINFLQLLKQTAGVLSDNATFILVIITGIYAFFTYRMAKIMTKQVVADIAVSDIVLGSQFSEVWFKEGLKNQPNHLNENSFFEFKLLFDVRNKSSGNGSIDKPTLLLKFGDFEYEIAPKTKESWNETLENTGAMSTYRTIVNDFGGTVFLRGGESRKIELEYTLYDPSVELLENVKNKLDSLEYHLSFSDNLGRDYRIKVDNVKGEREVRRR